MDPNQKLRAQNRILQPQVYADNKYLWKIDLSKDKCNLDSYRQAVPTRGFKVLYSGVAWNDSPGDVHCRSSNRNWSYYM